MRIAINGFGRIGRCIFRALLAQGWPDDLELVAINDPAKREALVYLLNHDSVHGAMAEQAALDGDRLRIGQRSIGLYAAATAEESPWRALGVDVLLECSGRFRRRDKAQQHLDAGAARLLMSAPLPDADATVVYGVNHRALGAAQRLVSCGSCTTNCLAPVAQVLHRRFGIESGQMTTVHAYTADQRLVDGAKEDLYRGRAAALSMIPTKTGAAKTIGLVLPELAGRLNGMAVRVPTPDVSLVDLHCLLERAADRDAINAAMRSAAEGELKGVLAYNEEPLVSVDFLRHPASSIFDANHTSALGRQIKVMAWYDNEWGFALRMLDVARCMGSLG